MTNGIELIATHDDAAMVVGEVMPRPGTGLERP